jgi:hypothetical protein
MINTTRQLHVLWISRAHQEQQQELNMTAWQRARVVSNERELIAGLEAAVKGWNRMACVPGHGAAGCREGNLHFTLKVIGQGLGFVGQWGCVLYVFVQAWCAFAIL